MCIEVNSSATMPAPGAEAALFAVAADRRDPEQDTRGDEAALLEHERPRLHDAPHDAAGTCQAQTTTSSTIEAGIGANEARHRADGIGRGSCHRQREQRRGDRDDRDVHRHVRGKRVRGEIRQRPQPRRRRAQRQPSDERIRCASAAGLEERRGERGVEDRRPR